MRLRKLLGTGAIETLPQGYRLSVPPDDVDTTGSNAFAAGLVSCWLWASPTELVSSPTRRWPSGRASRCSTSSTGTPDGWRATG